MYPKTEHATGGGAEQPCPGIGWDARQRALDRGRELQAVAMNQAVRRVAQAALGVLRAVLLESWRRSRRRRAATAALLSLNDGMLADIGLRRSDLQGLAYGIMPVERFAPAATVRDASTTELTHPSERDAVAPRRMAA